MFSDHSLDKQELKYLLLSQVAIKQLSERAAVLERHQETAPCPSLVLQDTPTLVAFFKTDFGKNTSEEKELVPL